MAGTLTLVGTPIGNLGDFSPRAVEALTQCGFIAAEDTRVTLKLLNHFGIQKPMVSYFEHNRRERGEMICERILKGESCCLVTDAGMPAISDPGEDLVALCHQKGIVVTAAPGPTAMATALALSGLPTGRFTFEGFLSVSRKSRREHLLSIRSEPRTMVFYEAPHKLVSLCGILEELGDRRLAIAREITKLHEQVIHTTLAGAAAYFSENVPRGEFVLVVEGAKPEQEESMTLEDAVELAMQLMEEGNSPTAAAKQAAVQSGHKKSVIYKAVLADKAHDQQP